LTSHGLKTQWRLTWLLPRAGSGNGTEPIGSWGAAGWKSSFGLGITGVVAQGWRPPPAALGARNASGREGRLVAQGTGGYACDAKRRLRVPQRPKSCRNERCESRSRPRGADHALTARFPQAGDAERQHPRGTPKPGQRVRGADRTLGTFRLHASGFVPKVACTRTSLAARSRRVRNRSGGRRRGRRASPLALETSRQAASSLPHPQSCPTTHTRSICSRSSSPTTSSTSGSEDTVRHRFSSHRPFRHPVATARSAGYLSERISSLALVTPCRTNPSSFAAR
jgi:hypothetical protein